jgi:nucleotide-sensitive chloride channel 1A
MHVIASGLRSEGTFSGAPNVNKHFTSTPLAIESPIPPAMALETLTTAPQLSDFTLLNEYSSQTPGTFFGGLPVLHLHAPSATLKLQAPDAASHPDFTALAESSNNSSTDGPVLIPSIDIWITSRALLLWSTTQFKGLQIPYPAITVTAQDRTEVLLELNLSAPDASDEDLDFLQIRLLANEVSHHAVPAVGVNGTAQEDGADASAKKLFKAISDCQELNPDPPAQGEDGEDGEGGVGFDPTAPGATGWITSENMADFMDENGEFRMPEGMTVIGGEEDGDEQNGGSAQMNGLGEGAGRRRTAAEIDGDAEQGAEGADGEESKWRRTG